MEVFNLQVLDTGSKVEERYVNLAVRCFEAMKNAITLRCTKEFVG